MDNKDDHKESMEGIVTARTCDCCGHHEIGMMTHKMERIFDLDLG